MTLHTFSRYALALTVACLTAVVANPVAAQLSPIAVIGVTPTCPYGIKGCAAAAIEGLSKLEGVKSVSPHPDAYNSTLDVELTGDALPPVAKWPEQLKAVVGEIFVFRGVELTVEGRLIKRDGMLSVEVEGFTSPIYLEPLEHKLQWNFRKRAARQPEPDELAAYRQLAAQADDQGSVKVQVTGPLQLKDGIGILEIREFFAIARTPEK